MLLCPVSRLTKTARKYYRYTYIKIIVNYGRNLSDERFLPIIIIKLLYEYQG